MTDEPTLCTICRQPIITGQKVMRTRIMSREGVHIEFAHMYADECRGGPPVKDNDSVEPGLVDAIRAIAGPKFR